MDSRDAEIRVGLAVILALSILVIGIIGGKEFALSTNRLSFDIVFANSSKINMESML